MIRVLIVARSLPRGERLARLLRENPKFDVVPSSGAPPRQNGMAELQADVVIREAWDSESMREWVDSAATAEAVILLTEDASSEVARDALRAGVRAVLPPSVNPHDLSAAVEAVAAGLVVLAPDQAEEIFEPTDQRESNHNSGFEEALTPREVDVLGLVAEGLANKEIAARLAISEHTAKFHVASIMGKLGATSRTEAVTAGIRRGLIII